MKHVNYLIIYLFLFFISCNGKASNETQNPIKKDSIITDTTPTKTTFVSPPKTDTVFTVIGVGDIMLGTLIPNKSYLPKNNDCTPLMADVDTILRNADVTFGNFEGVFTDTKSGAKHCNNPNTCYTFGMPESFIECLKNSGFDMLSVANNHSRDFGETGKRNTIRVIQESSLKFAGFIDYPTDIFIKNGIKYGLCAFAPNRGTCSILDYAKAKELVAKLEAECDVVIVSFHGGAEGSRHQHVPRKDEFYLGQNRGNVYKFAREVIDAGADIVFGHGPHVTRAIDLYKNRFISYSMGNFCTYSNMNITGVSGIAPILKIFVNKSGEFQKAQIIPTYQIKYVGTKIDPNKRVISKIQDLTKQDIPEANISISNDGWVTKNE